MKHQPNRHMDAPEADDIQAELDAEKEKGTIPMIYRDNRHRHTFERELKLHPEGVSRKALAALYLLTADRNLWEQVKDQVTIRKIYIDEMRPKNLTGTGYVFFSAARDILTSSRNIQLMEIADPALVSPHTFLVLCTALAIRAYGAEQASRIQFEKRWR